MEGIYGGQGVEPPALHTSLLELTEKKISSLLCFSIFLLYLVYLCPTTYNGDSPLLYASAFALGPAHSPGYPLYVILGKIFTFLPFGSIAYKMNLFSALCGTLTALLVLKSVYLLTEDKAVSMFSAFLSALLGLSWTESTKAEVYTLNSLLVILLFYLGVRFLKEMKDRRLLFLMSFILGMGMGNHHTIGFSIFPLIFILIAGVREKRLSTLIICFSFLALGMSVYLFSHIRSVRYFPDSLLFTYSDSSTFKAFTDTFFRKGYGSSIETLAVPIRSSGNWLYGPYNTAKYFLIGNFGAFVFLSLLSFPFLWRNKPIFSFSLLFLAAYGIILSAMIFPHKQPSNENLFDIAPYLLPLLYLVSINIGCGAAYALRLIKTRLLPLTMPISIGLVLLPFVFNLPHNLKQNNLSSYYLSEDFSNNLLGGLPPQSVVISGSDASYFPVIYKTLIERKRDDALILIGGPSGLLTQANPYWKYKALFPELPKGKLFIEDKADERFLRRGRVFAYSILTQSEKFKPLFLALPYIQSYQLFPKTYGVDERLQDETFKRAFEMFTYERSLNDKSNDVFSVEMKASAFITISHYAFLIRDENSLLSKSLYETSLKLISPEGLFHYMTYLDLTGRKVEIISFIESIEPYAEKYPEVRLLSQELKEKFLRGQ